MEHIPRASQKSYLNEHHHARCNSPEDGDNSDSCRKHEIIKRTPESLDRNKRGITKHHSRQVDHGRSVPSDHGHGDPPSDRPSDSHRHYHAHKKCDIGDDNTMTRLRDCRQTKENNTPCGVSTSNKKISHHESKRVVTDPDQQLSSSTPLKSGNDSITRSTDSAGDHRVADYFVVCGLDITCGLEPDKIVGESLHCAPLDRPYKPQILAKYPQEVAGSLFDAHAISMLCHPKGLRFTTQRDKRETCFHSFLLTREDGSRTYGTSLTFYEIVESREVSAAMQTLQAMHDAELSNAHSHTLYSHLTNSVYSRSPRIERRCNSQSSSKCSRTYTARTDTLWVSKSLCFVSQLPLVHLFERYLTALYGVVRNATKLELPLESFIYNLLFEVSLPPGRSLRVMLPTSTLVCQRPGFGELPLLDYPLRALFQLLGIEHVLAVFCSILLEHQLLLYSQHYQRLMLVAEGITALLFPFSWQHVYVPILPASLLHFLDAPVPFIMGVHGLTHSDDGQTLLTKCSKANMCLVDIDAGSVELPEDLPAFPQRDQLKEDVLLHMNKHSQVVHARDSGFRESFRDSLIIPDSGLNSSMGSEASSTWSLASKMEILQTSEALQKITALAKRTGVISSLDDISECLVDKPSTLRHAQLDAHQQDLVFNQSVREIFLHYFLQVFVTFEQFVIFPNTSDVESSLASRETMQNFDKTAFLSDQPDEHLPFLSEFLETQMFASLVDTKILSQWGNPDPGLKLFEERLSAMKQEMSDQRQLRHARHSHIRNAESIVEKRSVRADMLAPPPHPLPGVKTRPFTAGLFPILCSKVLDQNGADKSSTIKRLEGSKLRKRERFQQHAQHLQLSSEQKEKYMQEARGKAVRQPKLSDMESMADTNWEFVKALLKEIKMKTKRMLVEKMGQEAVELGHGDGMRTGVEENTMIATLCDLLERIWSHGRQTNQGKSALWTHMHRFLEAEDAPAQKEPDMTPGAEASWGAPKKQMDYIASLQLDAEPMGVGMQTWPARRHRRKPSRGNEMPCLEPLPVSVSYDLRSVQQMTEIKTPVGLARAWVRLSLEKKTLSHHLKELLSKSNLVKSLYKRHAFLRFEDEREQMLFHLMSLNAVDYYCFTNTFPNTMITYRVLVFPRMKVGGGTTTANCWLQLSGQSAHSPRTLIPKHMLDLTVRSRNLGVLTTLRIGHDNAGLSPRWMVEHVVVRNEITGHTFRFPCGRWLGKSVDDGSIERLLVAEKVPENIDGADLVDCCRTPPRCRSPSMPRRSNEPRMQVNQIQELLGNSVNNLVKHYFKPKKERGSVTGLLCGEYGLVFCLEHVFQCGFKSSRFLRNRFFVWDFIEKVQQFFTNILAEGRSMSEEKSRQMISYCRIVTAIENSSQSIGKDGKFQLFVCICVRDGKLHKFVELISPTPVTHTMYEELSFLRDHSLLTFLVQILESMKDFQVELEPSLVKDVNI